MVGNQMTGKPETLSRILKVVLLMFFGVMLLYFGKVLFAPLLFGLLIALILYPACKRAENWGLPRSISITIALAFIFILFIALVWLLGIEFNIFLSDLPGISNKLTQLSPDISKWVEQSFGLNGAEQSAWLHRFSTDFDKDISGFIKSLFNTTIATLIMMVMIPIYAALFLYHRETFVRYLELVIRPEHHQKLHLILHESVYSYFKFVKGNFYVYCIVGLLNFIGLLALGIEHAFLYGMLTSFMMIIPYVGIFISAAIPVSIALVTKDSAWYPIGVILIFVFIQYLESNIIFPRVVGTQLNLSTWATLVAIVAATIIWGIAGMVLITPFLSMVKIITDHVPEWKAVNILLNRSEGYKMGKKK